MKRYRLLTRAEINGAIREPGYVFSLEDGVMGPHRTVVASNHGAQITDHINGAQELTDVPMYEDYVEPEVKEQADRELISPPTPR